MKVCIFGAGAVGGFLGARLAQSGYDVSAVARGATAAALRKHGLRVQSGDELSSAAVTVAENPADLGAQDLVVVAVKGPAMASVASRIAPLLGADTMVLTAMNGVPWWFFHGFGGKFAGTPLLSIDPDGAIAAAIPDRHVVGCVVHLSCATPEPGIVRHVFGNQLIIGEPNRDNSGRQSPRVEALAAMLAQAGFATTVSASIQSDIWYKLWGNMTMNPVSALTGATVDRIVDDPLVLRFCLAAMAEAAAVGTAIGCPIAQSGEDRIGVARKLGAFKTSMLQDVEAGKPVELDALVTVVREIGERAGIATPNVDALLGLARVQAQTRGLYPR